MEELIKRLQEESQDNPDSLEWQAADALAQQQATIKSLNDALRITSQANANLSAELAELRQQIAEAKPVAWIDKFGNAYPLNAWKPKNPTYHDDFKSDWKPLYTTPQPCPKCAKGDTRTLDVLRQAYDWIVGSGVVYPTTLGDNIRALITELENKA